MVKKVLQWIGAGVIGAILGSCVLAVAAPATFVSLVDSAGHLFGTAANPLNVAVVSGGGGTSNVNIADFGATPVTLGANLSAASMPVALASDETLNVAGVVTATGTVNLGAGSAVIGHVIADTGSTTAVTGSVAATNAGTFATQAQPTPVTSGGLSSCYLQATASTNATNCKASAGQIYGFRVTNNSNAINYVRFYNLSSAPTCSSATGLVDAFAIPGPASGGGGIVEDIPTGEAFSTGIGFCLTGAIGSTDTTNATASAVQITVLYK